MVLTITFNILIHKTTMKKGWSFRALICGFPQGEQIGTLLGEV